ncbi:MAG TPA: DinB family protein [Bryobacteraceae bacterium]|nr:DinB family protein [Bryobacteraceae bacterium]
MKALSARLLAAVASAEAILGTISEADSAKPVLSGGWSSKQVIGHLVDSASNNHQRFVRAVLEDSLTFPNYHTDAWSRVECVQDADWTTLIALWANYNRYLAHVIAHLPAGKLDVPCSIGPNDPVPLRSVVEGYLEHMEHHLGQIGAAGAAS